MKKTKFPVKTNATFLIVFPQYVLCTHIKYGFYFVFKIEFIPYLSFVAYILT